MKLYYHPLSGHSHRARLFLSLLGIEQFRSISRPPNTNPPNS